MDEGDSDVEFPVQEIPLVPNPLTKELVPKYLSVLTKAGNGLEYSYVKFKARNRALTNIDVLADFKYLKYVDISYNKISDLKPLCNVTFLTSVRAESNLLNEGIRKDMKFLQLMDLSKNDFTTIEGVFHPELEILHLKFNKLKVLNALQPSRLTRLHTLELRGNHIETTAGLNLPNLVNLYMADNQINQLEDLGNLISLQCLHVRNNQIENLNGFTNKMIKLMYLNLRENKIDNLDEICKLNCLPRLAQLVILENSMEVGSDDLVIDVLMRIPGLSRVNKMTVTNSDRREAKKRLKCLMAPVITEVENDQDRPGNSDI